MEWVVLFEPTRHEMCMWAHAWPEITTRRAARHDPLARSCQAWPDQFLLGPARARAGRDDPNGHLWSHQSIPGFEAKRSNLWTPGVEVQIGKPTTADVDVCPASAKL